MMEIPMKLKIFQRVVRLNLLEKLQRIKKIYIELLSTNICLLETPVWNFIRLL